MGPINAQAIQPDTKLLAKYNRNIEKESSIYEINHIFTKPNLLINFDHNGIEMKRVANKHKKTIDCCHPEICNTYLQYIGYKETIIAKIAIEKDCAML